MGKVKPEIIFKISVQKKICKLRKSQAVFTNGELQNSVLS